jgi:hypothetical protein
VPVTAMIVYVVLDRLGGREDGSGDGPRPVGVFG